MQRFRGCFVYCEVYLDVFFVVNLIPCFFVLCLTNQLLTGAANSVRAFLGAAIGAIGNCFILVFSKEFISLKNGNFYVVTAVLMVCIGCGIKGLKNFILKMCVFLGCNFLLGGFLFVFSQRVRKGIFTFGFITTLCYWILYIGIRLCKYLKRKRELYCEVRIVLNGKEINIKGLYDTGNCLYDRATGKAVCVIEKDSFFQLLTEKQQQFLENFCTMEMTEEKEAEEEAVFFRGLNPRFLPYTSVGCQKGLLPIVTVDRITVREQEEERKIQRAAVGISYTKLSEKGRFQAIISPEVWEK